MDSLNLSYTISKEDFVGILRTIWLFLENVDFKETSAALQKECVSKGYGSVADAPPKVIVVSPSPINLPLENQIITPDSTEDVTSYQDVYIYYNKPTDAPPDNTQSDFQGIKLPKNSSQEILISGVEDEIELLEKQQTPEVSTLCSKFESHQDLREKFKELQTEHEKLVNVTMSLTEAVQTHILGQSESLNNTLNNCKTLYPDLFVSKEQQVDNIQQEDKSVKTSSSQTKTSVHSQTSRKNMPIKRKDHTCLNRQADKGTDSGKCEDLCVSCWESFNKHICDLDFDKLKCDLWNGERALKISLLQALRWRLTQNDALRRQHALSCYLRYDLLELEKSTNLIEHFLFSTESTTPMMQEQMARILNTFASLTQGRDYLCRNDNLLVSVLIPSLADGRLIQDPKNRVTRNMLLATLEKLSLRRKQRTLMISKGFLQFLLSFLANYNGLLVDDEYCMEYATALFMNLCLEKEAKVLLSSNANTVVQLLTELMDPKFNFCMPYVNGAAYSLLLCPKIREEAHNADFGNILKHHIDSTKGEMHTQLDVILRLYEFGPDDSCECETHLDPEEFDLLEPELDKDDSFKQKPLGEELLDNYKTFFPICDIPNKCICRRTRAPDKQQMQSIGTSPVAESVRPINQKNKFVKTMVDQSTKPIESVGTSPINEDYRKKENAPYRKNDKQSLFKSGTSKKSSSSTTTFCEETKQFYHKPSAHSRIFEKNKSFRLHRLPPSFTITIPMAPRQRLKCKNPHCPFPYEKVEPMIPKENSSAQNPPYALSSYVPRYTTCYRESFSLIEGCNSDCGGKDKCCCCSTRNKYACKCYDVIKECLDAKGDDQEEKGKKRNSSRAKSEERTKSTRVHKNV